MQDNDQNNPDIQPDEQPVVSTQGYTTTATPLEAQQTTVMPSETSNQINSSDKPESPKKKKEGGIFSFILTLLAAFVLVQVINMFFFQSYKVFGSSMFPTLHDGDRLIISKVGRSSSKIQGKDYVPARGDIVVFADPRGSGTQLIKRVIGFPGERVVVKDGKLTVYNKANPKGFNPDESGAYTADIPASSGANDVTVPARHLFVSGDNREGANSLDSRNELGTVPEELIVGTLKVRIFPFDGAKFF